MRPMLEHSVAHNSVISQDSLKHVQKNTMTYKVSRLTFSLFITFLLNYAIFNLQLLVSYPIQDGPFRGCSWMLPPTRKISHTVLAIMKPCTVIA